MTSEHAPGWKFVQHEGPEPPRLLEATRLPGNFYDEQGRRIGMFGTSHCLLIAAAPVMLKALKAVQEWICDDGPVADDGINNPAFVKASNAVLAAIATAEGR